MNRFLKNKKAIGLIFSILFIVLTVCIAIGAYFSNDFIQSMKLEQELNKQQQIESSQISQPSSDAISSSQDSATSNSTSQAVSSPVKPTKIDPEIDSSITFDRPSEMRATYIVAGVDYLSKLGSDEAIKAEIDKMIESASSLMMNTLIVDPIFKEKTIYQTSLMPSVPAGFDILDYIIEKAKAKGMYVYLFYDILKIAENSVVKQQSVATTEVFDFAIANAKEIANKYKINGILLDDYYNIENEKSYLAYMQSGIDTSYDSYMKELPMALLTSVRKSIKQTNPAIEVGLVTDAVWEDKTSNEKGSNTNSTFTTLSTGNVDTKKVVEIGLVDFIMVKAYTAIGDKSVPFTEVVKWWDNVANAKGIPLHIIQAADKACTKETGWSAPDQLTRQVIEARKTKSYKGSVFNSLNKLSANPKESTTTLLKLFKDEVNIDFILKDLTITKPEKKEFTTYEPKMNFAGASDPTFEVTLNGEKIQTDESGFFSKEVDLKAGANKFTFHHKEKNIVFNITRKVQILKEIGPLGNVAVDGAMKINVSALAYADAKVTATLGGKTISLTLDTTGTDEADKNSNYQTFVGEITVPAGTNAVQQLGNVKISASWQGVSEALEGASIKINKKIDQPLPGGTGPLVEVIVDQALTYSAKNMDIYSDPSSYPLPKGTIDYIVGDEITYKEGKKTYSYYKLASNVRVRTEDVRRVTATINPNKINGITVDSDALHTKVILATEQKVAYNVTYNQSTIAIKFQNTNTTPTNMQLTQNPLFSSANWSNGTLTLTLRKQGSFMGYRAYYEGSNLVLRFNNPPSSLAGARIVIDPGHSVKDPGAPGFNPNYPEQYINNQIAQYLKTELQNRGATVMLINTQSGGIVLETRMEQARSFNPHMFLSVHNNSSVNSNASGTETFYFYNFSKSIASGTAQSISSAFGANNRGVKFGQYYTTRTAEFVSVLLECAFLTNQGDYNKLLNPAYQQSIATGIVNGVTSYLNSVNTGFYATGTQTNGDVVAGSPNPPVNGTLRIELSKTQTSLAVGATEQLQATVVPYDAPIKKIIWSTANANIATVDANTGLITGKSVGETTITAMLSDGSIMATCKVSVTPSTGTKIELNKTQLTLTLGASEKLTAKTNPPNTQIIWTTSNSQVAIVSDGLVQAVGIGQAIITAIDPQSGTAVSCNVIVKPVNVGESGFALNKISTTIVAGAKEVLVPVSLPTNAQSSAITWTTSDNTVAAVDSQTGEVSALKPGTSVVTAHIGEVSSNCVVIVADHSAQPSTPDQNIAIQVAGTVQSQYTMHIGSSFEIGEGGIQAVEMPKNIAHTGVTWSVQTISGATPIYTDGTKVQAVGHGTAELIATTQQDGKIAKLFITVPNTTT